MQRKDVIAARIAAAAVVAALVVSSIAYGVTFYLGWRSVSPDDVCRRLRAEGAAERCRPGKRGPLNPNAVQVIDFDVPGCAAMGQVMSFRKRHEYKTAWLAYSIAALLGGKLYGSPEARVIVQVGNGVPPLTARDIERTVDEL